MVVLPRRKRSETVTNTVRCKSTLVGRHECTVRAYTPIGVGDRDLGAVDGDDCGVGGSFYPRLQHSEVSLAAFKPSPFSTLFYWKTATVKSEVRLGGAGSPDSTMSRSERGQS